MKTCPYCAEEIKLEAIVCRYCNNSLTEKIKVIPEASKKDYIEKTDNILIRIFTVLSLFFVIFLVYGNLVNLAQTSTSEVDRDLKMLDLQMQEYHQAIEDANKQDDNLPLETENNNDYLNRETLYTFPEDESYKDSNTESLYTPLTEEPEYYGTNIDEYNQYTGQENSYTEAEINQLINQGELDEKTEVGGVVKVFGAGN